jgi:hypothetical protein
MKEMTSSTMPEEPILYRPMLESLEPRRLLSAAMPETVVSFTEFNFGASGGSSTAPEAVHVDFHPYMSAPLATRRFAEGFDSGFADRSFSVVFFVTPWSPASAPIASQPSAQTPSTPTDVKQVISTPTDPSTKSGATDQVTTLSLDDAKAITALPSVQPTASPAVFATKVVEQVDSTPHATAAKSTSEATSHGMDLSTLSQMLREDEIFQLTQTTQSAKPWFQVLDRDLLHQQNRTDDVTDQMNGTPTQVAMHQEDQAESLRTLAHRIALRQSISKSMQPVAASIESTPVSVWQRVAMVTLTGGALVANWYVRRRRNKLALSGFEKGSIGRHPHLP